MHVWGVESHAGALIMSAQRTRPSSGPNTTKPAMVPHQRRDKTGALVSPNGVKLAFRGRRQKVHVCSPAPPKQAWLPQGRTCTCLSPALVEHVKQKTCTGAPPAPGKTRCTFFPCGVKLLSGAGDKKCTFRRRRVKTSLTPSGKKVHLFFPGVGRARSGLNTRKLAMVPRQHR